MKKKQLIRELENLYASRFGDYERFLAEEKYEEATRAFNDSKDILVSICEIKKIKFTDIAKVGIDGLVGLGSLATFGYLGVKSFKFEETGTFSSTGGKNIAAESFRKLAPPKKM